MNATFPATKQFTDGKDICCEQNDCAVTLSDIATDTHAGPAAPANAETPLPRPLLSTLCQAASIAWWRILLPVFVLLLVLITFAMLYYSSTYFSAENDFGRFYYATLHYVQGSDMYINTEIPIAKVDAEWTLAGEDWRVDLLNLNPPHFHFLLLPLVGLERQFAAMAWLSAGIISVFLCFLLVTGEMKIDWTPRLRDMTIFLILAAEVTKEVILCGQVSWIILVPVTLMWLAARRDRWMAAGAILGVLASMKLFFIFLFPYLLLQKKWRAAAAAVGAGLAVTAAGVIVFGADTYVNWLGCLSGADDWAFYPNNAGLWGAFVRLHTENPSFIPFIDLPIANLKLMWLAVAGSIGVLTLAATVWDRSAERVDRAFALLLTTAVLLNPLGWVYYFWLPVPAFLALMVAWSKQRKEMADRSWWARNWRFVLLGSTLPFLICPFPFTFLLQPSPWATLFFGNMYTWALLIAWTTLMTDSIGRSRLSLLQTRRYVPCTPIPSH